LLSFIFCNK